MEQEFDQAAMMQFIVYTHLHSMHKDGIPDPQCQFCKNFVITEESKPYPLEAYKLIITDVSGEQPLSSLE